MKLAIIAAVVEDCRDCPFYEIGSDHGASFHWCKKISNYLHNLSRDTPKPYIDPRCPLPEPGL